MTWFFEATPNIQESWGADPAVNGIHQTRQSPRYVNHYTGKEATTTQVTSMVTLWALCTHI
jgi:hypothetical protein